MTCWLGIAIGLVLHWNYLPKQIRYCGSLDPAKICGRTRVLINM
jgi:hypothetical protein